MLQPRRLRASQYPTRCMDTLFVSPDALKEFTGRKRPSAQARWLSGRGYKFERRADGSIALRKEEMDSRTLTKPESASKRTWRQDLSLMKRSS